MERKTRSIRSLAQFVALTFFGALLTASAAAQNNSPSATSALPHDSHAGITVSASPVTDPSRAKHIFSKADPLPAGILPVEVFFRNDTSQPVQIGLDSIQLDVHYENGRMDGVDSLTPGQVALLIAHPHGNPGAPRQRRFPIGVGSVGDKKVDQLTNILRPLALNSDIVPPMGAIHGYVFFDLRHDMSLVPQSSLYIPDAVVIPSKKALIFFEVSFAKP